MARNRLYGIGEPLTMRSLKGEIDAMKGLDLMAAVGVTSFREWMYMNVILKDAVTPDMEKVAAFTRTFDRCKELDIEVTGVGHGWFPAGPFTSDYDYNSCPARDLTPGSPYMQTLERVEQTWHTLVSLFPQVPQWEVGNEWNLSIFLHPIGWKWVPGAPVTAEGFSYDEAMHIAADTMYYAARGIRRANPEAKVVSFSPCVHGGIPAELRGILPPGCAIAITVDKIYRIIESGESFSTNSDDYFDLWAWHPYLSTQMGYAPIRTAYPAATDGYNCDELPDGLWKSWSDRAYDVMAKHGDGHKKVLFTEFGYSDAGNPAREAEQVPLVYETFRTAAQMPYLHSLHFFRLFEEETSAFNAAADGSANPSEIHFGIFREPHHDYEPRAKAKALQEVYGGTGDLDAISTQK